jgi:hypothetical protein
VVGSGQGARGPGIRHLFDQNHDVHDHNVTDR